METAVQNSNEYRNLPVAQLQEDETEHSTEAAKDDCHIDPAEHLHLLCSRKRVCPVGAVPIPGHASHAVAAVGPNQSERLGDSHAVIHSGSSKHGQHSQSHGSSSGCLLGEYIWHFQHAFLRQAVFARRHPPRP